MLEVALRYAEALYMLAVEENNLLSLQSEANEIKKLLIDNEKYIKVLSSNFLSKNEREELLSSTFKSVDKTISAFLHIILLNNRFNLIIDILEAFNDYCNRHQGIKEGIIFTTMPMEPSTLEKIEEKISKLENTKVHLKVKIDPSLIGGYKVVINEHQYDRSIAKQIEMMRKNLL